jgi:hypothetical protein
MSLESAWNGEAVEAADAEAVCAEQWGVVGKLGDLLAYARVASARALVLAAMTETVGTLLIVGESGCSGEVPDHDALLDVLRVLHQLLFCERACASGQAREVPAGLEWPEWEAAVGPFADALADSSIGACGVRAELVRDIRRALISANVAVDELALDLLDRIAASYDELGETAPRVINDGAIQV